MGDSDAPGATHHRSLVHNPITYAGAGLALASAIIIASLFLISWNSPTVSPYLGIVSYLIVPTFLALGLIIIPIGMGVENRRRRRTAGSLTQAPPPFPRIDLNQTRHQVYTGVFVVGSLFAIALLGTAAYQSYNFMDSVTFCGETCHSVMQPEYTAYLDSPHARVSCTACHIGPGASWYVRSKASGLYQVYAVLTNSYPLPITTPVENLRPARETCEECHWPEKFYGDKIVTHARFQSDEKNTVQKTSLVVKTGGGSERAGISTGIHWHMDPRNEVDYVATDGKRQQIAWVASHGPDGKTTEYFATDKPLSPDQLKSLEQRAMDCIDCHNRPTHIYYKPEDAVDREMTAGRIDATLPFAKKTGVELIKRQYASQDEAKRAIASDWEKYYRDNYPQVYGSKGEAIKAGGLALAGIYVRNVFPVMNVGWETYVDNIGHQSSPGCFRCHDGKHASKDGQVISNDCTLCHSRPVAGEITGLAVAPATPAGPTPQPTAQPTVQPSALPASTQPPAQVMPTRGGLHTKQTHAATACQICHKVDAPTSGATIGRDSCLTCHADRQTHNAGITCQTCHSFK